MTEKPEPSASATKAKKPLAVLRERRGGVPHQLTERQRRQKAIRKSITAALQDGARTVPELAHAVALPADEVFWHVMGMKKYGKVCEAEQVDGYFRYALVPESPETEHLS
ncbi:MAG: hypothetical protein RBS80_13065 [Thermoguttaceae bacterium]|jgi:predicted Rossmann fold nucleotide-binding protein DprA/Smf involved in DNA uptake|nr:hypothetical protein [Thermoguttaceae bacterium]